MNSLSRRSVLKLTLPALGVAFAPRATAAPSDKPLFSFGLLADPQYVDAKPKGSRHYRASLGKLKACIDAFNQEDLEFVMTLGDIIDRDFKSFDDILPIYAKLKAKHRCVLGNHDFEVADRDKPKVPAKLGMKERHAAENCHGWRMIRLDGTEMAAYPYLKGSPNHARGIKVCRDYQKAGIKNALSYNGGIGKEQLTWLDKQLTEASKAGERAIVFCHFPLLPKNGVHNLWNASGLIELLEKHPHVAAYFNGHHHAGGYSEKNGIHYLNLKGMVETPDQTAYAIVRVFPDRLEVEGHGLEPARTLK